MPVVPELGRCLQRSQFRVLLHYMALRLHETLGGGVPGMGARVQHPLPVSIDTKQVYMQATHSYM